MSKWARLDIWSEDDPAVARLREALALRPPTEAPETPKAPEVAPEPTPDRRTRIADLVARLKSGDPSARQLLEDLLR